jgi:alpha-methylacyl-CoA racemase
MKGPLEGIRVIDCTRLLPSAYGTLLLAELGAEVIKVEQPEGGDYGRQMPRSFAIANRGKRSISLDIKAPEGQGLLRRLLADADVLVDSYRPGVLAAFGLAPEQLGEEFPDLVHCSATGYGYTGPLARRAGHDLNYMGLAGVTQPVAEVEPKMLIMPVADMSIGIWLVGCISAALLQVKNGGGGQHLDLSMTDIVFSMNLTGLAKGRKAAPPPMSGPGAEGDKLGGYPWPELLVGDYPCYGIFAAGDGRKMTLCNIEGKFWRNFVDAIERPDLVEDKFATGERGEFARAEIERELAKQPLAHWERVFGEVDVCYAALNTAEEASLDAQLNERGVMSWEGEQPILGLPARLSGVDYELPGPAPELGADNEAIFGELGLSAAERAALRDRGVV